MQGTPDTMQKNPSYKNVVQEVKEFLEESVKVSKFLPINIFFYQLYFKLSTFSYSFLEI